MLFFFKEKGWNNCAKEVPPTFEINSSENYFSINTQVNKSQFI